MRRIWVLILPCLTVAAMATVVIVPTSTNVIVLVVMLIVRTVT